MSNKALNWAWEAIIANAPAKFVLVALADHASDHAGEDWTCFPSNDRLINMTGMPQRSVERALGWLADREWISRTSERDRRGRLRVRRYQLHRGRVDLASDDDGFPIKDLVETDGGEACPPANMAGGEGVEPSAKSMPDHPPKTASPPATVAGGHNRAEPPEEPLENPQTVGARADGEGLVDADFEAVFSAWQSKAPGRLSRKLDWPAWRSTVLRIAPDRLRAAALRYLAHDADAARHGPMSLHRWLAEERWEPWLPSAGTSIAAADTGDRPVFDGPPEVRDRFAQDLDEGAMGSWFAPCSYAPGPPARLIARTSIAADWLRRNARAALNDLNLTIEVLGRA